MYTDTVSSFKVFNLDIIPSLNIECLYDFDFIDRSVKTAQVLFVFSLHAGNPVSPIMPIRTMHQRPPLSPARVLPQASTL